MKYIIILSVLLLAGCTNEAEVKANQEQSEARASEFAKRFNHDVECYEPVDIELYTFGRIRCNGLTDKGLQVQFECDRNSCSY